MPRKPQPLVIDGHYRYTLSSYEPVSITVTVPYLTEDEVDYGVEEVLCESGLAEGEHADDAWVRAHVPGVSGTEELARAVRAQLEAINARNADASRPMLCADALAERLEQDVPDEEVAKVKARLMEDIDAKVRQAGLTLDEALVGMGMAATAVEAMLDAQARAQAERGAALDAMADEMGISVDETELPGLLGTSPKATRELVADARAHGRLGEVLWRARRNKASASVTAACSCTYEHESPEQAERRVRMAQERMDNWTMPDGSRPDRPMGPKAGHDGPRPDSRSHLRLV